MKKYGLSRRQRLRSGADFERVYARKLRAGDRHLLVFGSRNKVEITRLGLSVSRRHGNAVKRSRLKRMLREAFRLSQHDLPRGLDLIVIPRDAGAATLDELRRSLERAARKIAGRLPPETEDGP